MNFGEVFANWIKMLHEGARTRFILGFLTGDIEVSFSIRQGDPLSLYISYPNENWTGTDSIACDLVTF